MSANAADSRDLFSAGTETGNDAIRDRKSQELVFALIGPVGSGVTEVGRCIKTMLEDRYGYEVKPIIKMSDFIKENAGDVGVTLQVGANGSDIITKLQSAGNSLREKRGLDYLARKAIARIFNYRQEGGYNGDVKTGLPKVLRRAYIMAQFT